MLATRILYVEDDDQMRDSLARGLTLEGYDVTPVSSAEAALAELQAAQYDLLLTDYRLPGKHADWLLERATALGWIERSCVIVLSGETRPAGIEGYCLLRKPVELEVLLAEISRALETEATPLAPDEDLPLSSGGADTELVLYVTGTSPKSQAALRNLQRALRSLPPGQVQLTVCDVAQRSPDVSAELDRVLVTPTLVRRRPLPKVSIVGDLSESGALARLLDGGRRKRGPIA